MTVPLWLLFSSETRYRTVVTTLAQFPLDGGREDRRHLERQALRITDSTGVLEEPGGCYAVSLAQALLDVAAERTARKARKPRQFHPYPKRRGAA